MKIIFKSEREEEPKEVNTNAKTVAEFLEEQELNPVIHVVSLDGEVVTEDEELAEGNELKVQKVVSGG